MIYYKIQIAIKESLENSLEEINDYALLGQKANQLLEGMKYREKPVVAYVVDIDDKNISISLAKFSEDIAEEIYCEIVSKVEEAMSIVVADKKVKEVTIEEFRSHILEASNRGYVRNSRKITSELKIDFENNHAFEVTENITVAEPLTKEVALESLKELMGGNEFEKEIERIYCKENKKEFYCHPVHYHIKADSEDSAKEMTNLLLRALINNGRLLGRRISYIYDMKKSCYEEEDFENLISNSQGATVIISLNTGDNKSVGQSDAYEEVIAYIEKIVKKYQKNVLFIFCEVTNKNSIGRKILSELEEIIRIIDLEEGVGKKEQAEAALRNIILKSEYAQFLEEEETLEIESQESYTLSEIYRMYDKWIEQVIYGKLYTSYGLKEKPIVEKNWIEGSAYEELDNMIGLEKIKDLVKDIIAMNKIQKLRKDMGYEKQQGTLHMLFTGNPGCAKTTVARLVTQILYEEGVIQNNKIVECGRGDLVGKYVGWTAKQVKSKFWEAREGVLFIDEAYSLIDDRKGSFGDEAINTIVQEMENHRTDVIVIFAGYPEQMKLFLEKNEGLRSRISFHLDFPNYSPEELTKILSFMIEKRGYTFQPEVLEKSLLIFEKARSNKDFGNGRYVRNLLEHAIMRQSKRLMKEYAGIKISEKQINCLIADDFEEMEMEKEKLKYTIGFQMT